MNKSIEDKVNAALQSVKNIKPAELPEGFSDRVVSRLHEKDNNVRSMFVFSPLLKVAAVFILILVNVFTLRFALSPQPIQNPSQKITIKDFVNEYQINDANEEVAITNTPAHE